MMTTKFMMSGTSVSVIRLNEDTAVDTLPPQIYTVKHSDMMGFYLDIVTDTFSIPEKIYGNCETRVQKCITTYQSRDNSTGILLTGDKGTGKSLMMSLLSNAVINQLKMPIILIRTPFSGDNFLSFIEQLGECCLVFDEFGKMYEASKRADGPSQDTLLTLMDGMDKTKRMILLSENSTFDINQFMLNRPSRIYYHFKYTKLDEDSIKGYCQDKKVDIKTVRDIVDLSRRSKLFTFDMLQCIVEEFLRFGEKISEVVNELNIDISESYGTQLKVIEVKSKHTNETHKMYGSDTIPQPNGEYDYTYLKITNYLDESNKTPVALNVKGKALSVDELEAELSDDVECEDEYIQFSIKASQLAYQHAGKLIYETKDYVVVTSEVPPSMLNFSQMV